MFYYLLWYQFIIELNMFFYLKLLELLDDDILWEIQEKGYSFLECVGYYQYEILGYVKVGY